jgi:hypothetical protein
VRRERQKKEKQKESGFIIRRERSVESEANGSEKFPNEPPRLFSLCDPSILCRKCVDSDARREKEGTTIVLRCRSKELV